MSIWSIGLAEWPPRTAPATSGDPPPTRALHEGGRLTQLAGIALFSQILQQELDVGHRLEPSAGILAQAETDHLFQFGGDAAHQLAGGLWLFAQDSRQNQHFGFALKSPPPGEHFVEDRAKREDVGARIDFLTFHLLG